MAAAYLRALQLRKIGGDPFACKANASIFSSSSGLDQRSVAARRATSFGVPEFGKAPGTSPEAAPVLILQAYASETQFWRALSGRTV